jgi:hypothetical protein
VRDENGVPIPNATGQLFLEVFDRLGLTRILYLASVVDGEFSLNLNGEVGGETYNLKVLRPSIGAGLMAPAMLGAIRQSHIVYDPIISSNDAYLTMPSQNLPSATESDMCRLAASFLRQDGIPYQGYAFSIHTRQVPRSIHRPISGGLQGAFLVGDRIDLRADKWGEVIFDLPRGGIYTAVMPDYVDEENYFIVPDSPSADLLDLVLIYPKSVTYSPSSLALSVGDEVEVDVSMLMSDGQIEDPLCGNFYEPSTYLSLGVTPSPAPVEAEWSQNSRAKLTIRAISTGTAQVSVTTKDPKSTNLAVQLPRAAVQQTPLSVTVT